MPKCEDPSLQNLWFRKYKTNQTQTSIEPERVDIEYDYDILQTLEQANNLPEIIVPQYLKNPHQLIRATKEALLLHDYADQHNLYGSFSQTTQTLKVSVTRKNINRAMCIADTLIKTIEKIGGKAEILDKEYHRSEVRIKLCGETVISNLSIRERYNQKRIPPKKQNQSYFYPKVEYIPNDLLVIEDKEYFTSIICNDTPKKKKIENQLNKVIIDLVIKAGNTRIYNKQKEKEEAIRGEREKIRHEKLLKIHKLKEELAKKQTVEKSRIQKLIEDSGNLQLSRNIRNFILEVEKSSPEKQLYYLGKESLSEWVKWAKEQADRFDPFTLSPNSILDEFIEEPDECKEKDFDGF